MHVGRIADLKQVNIVSYGAGVDSTAMILKMIDEGMKIDHVVFADTGGELPETYDIVKKMKDFLSRKSIPFTIVKNFSLVTLLERCIARHVFPDMFRRWCTRDFKVAPIHRFYKKQFKGLHINEYLGIDAKETKRIRKAKEDYITKFYPLVDWDMDRLQCESYLIARHWEFVIKSGCYFCPFNSSSRWDYIKDNHPKLYRLTKKLERNSKHYPKMKLINRSRTSDDLCGNGFS